MKRKAEAPKATPASVALPHGYYAVELALPDKPQSVAAPVRHTLYFAEKEHDSASGAAQPRLALSNLPVDTTEAQLRELFTALGCRLVEFTLHSAAWERRQQADAAEQEEMADSDDDDMTDHLLQGSDKRQAHLRARARWPMVDARPLVASGCRAVALFHEETEFHRAFAALRAAGGSGIAWPADPTRPLGLSRYRAQYIGTFPDPSRLQEACDAYMELFADYERANRRGRGFMLTEPDEEGFVTVTRGLGSTGVTRNPATRASVSTIRKQHGDKASGYPDFYRWQTREAKRKEFDRLRSEFEHDKARVAEMKTRRRFKPY